MHTPAIAAFLLIATVQVAACSSDGAVNSTPLPPPAPGAVADPTALPRATSQRPVAGSYGRSLSAGQTYVDPNSGVTVLKLTDASTPEVNGGMYHGYSEGGPNISQPWTGSDGATYYTVKVGDWLVDVHYGTLALSNWREVSYDGEIGFAFSLHPATPRIAYVANDERVDRYNTATNRVENTGRWPWVVSAAGSSLEWLQTQVNDTWLVGMLTSNETIVAFRPSDGLQRAVTEATSGVNIDEPHLDREYPVVYISGGNSGVQNKLYHLETGTYTVPQDPTGVNADDHAAALRGMVVAVSWQADGVIAVDHQGVLRVPVRPSPTDWGGDFHMAGQWVFENPTQYFVVDQWQDTGNFAIYRGMMGFVNLAGDVRLIGATDAVGSGYNTGGQPHPTLAPDVKFVMWTSNMNGAGRHDTFLARIPAR